MRCGKIVVFLVLINCSLAEAVDFRFWLAPVAAGQVPWIGAGGPFAPTLVGATGADGGVGAAIYTSATVSTAGINPPAPMAPVLEQEANGEIFGIWARTENDTASEGSRVWGMSLVLQQTPGLVTDVQWIQWRSGTAPTYRARWQASSDFLGDEVTFVGSDSFPGWQFQLGTSDRLDRWTTTVPKVEPGDYAMGNGEILLGYIRVVSGAGAVRIRLGSNGINHVSGSRVAFGDGTEYIPGGGGAPGRGYGDQLVVLPEPASLLFLALPLVVPGRRALLPISR